jgi:cbb3-type cytochrome oxidase maturation protein
MRYAWRPAHAAPARRFKAADTMDIIFLLVPLSVVLVLGLIGLLAWTLHNGQFDNLEHEGVRILLDEPDPACTAQSPSPTFPAAKEIQA